MEVEVVTVYGNHPERIGDRAGNIKIGCNMAFFEGPTLGLNYVAMIDLAMFICLENFICHAPKAVLKTFLKPVIITPFRNKSTIHQFNHLPKLLRWHLVPDSIYNGGDSGQLAISYAKENFKNHKIRTLGFVPGGNNIYHEELQGTSKPIQHRPEAP